MRLPPALLALAVSAVVLGVLPAMAVELAPDPSDPVADHAAHDAQLQRIPVTSEAADDRAVQDLAAGQAGWEPDAVTYEIQEGDTLATIAAEYHLDELDDWRLLFDANPEVEHPDLVEPGMVIRIPDPDEDLARRRLPAPLVTAGRAGRGGAPTGGAVWRALAACESGGRNVVSSNGLHYGYFQFLPSTWHGVGGTGLPTDHSYDEQLRRAQILQSRAGWGQWPACARVLGLR